MQAVRTHLPYKEGAARHLCREGKPDGKLYSLVYGKVISMNVDPIEKKTAFSFPPRFNVLLHRYGRL